MSETINALDILEQLEAQLQNTKPSSRSGSNELPAGLYQGVLKGVSELKTFQRDSRTIPFVQFLFEILADSHENKFQGRTYKLLQSFDTGDGARMNDNGDVEDLATYRGRVQDFGLPDDFGTKPKLLMEAMGPASHTSEYREQYGPLPCVEFKLVAGERPNKKGKIPIFFNFVRRLDPEEAGEIDAFVDEANSNGVPVTEPAAMSEIPF